MKRQLSGAFCMIAVLVLSGCGDDTADQADPSEVWQATDQSPLSPRERAVAVTIGDRVLVVGGSDAPPCPPGGDCSLPEKQPLFDAALFDPLTGEWARTAAAPLRLGGHIDARTAVIGDTAYFLAEWYVAETERVQIAFLSYDAVADAWTELPNPPAEAASRLQLTAAGDNLVAYPGSHETMDMDRTLTPDQIPPDLLFRPADQSWHELPADPHGPSFDRNLLAVGNRLILLAKDLVADPGVDPPLVRMATLDVAGDPNSAQWTALPDGEFLWPDGYVSVGGLLLSPYLGSADGGEVNNWGRAYPYGGVIDPATGEWTAFPSVPEQDPRAWGVGPASISGNRTLINGPWVVDSQTLEWTQVPQRALDAEGNEAPFPTTNHAAALIDTPDGPVAFVWGGTLWSDPDSPTSEYELLDDGWLWRVPTP
jgi:hypothetical protein